MIKPDQTLAETEQQLTSIQRQIEAGEFQCALELLAAFDESDENFPEVLYMQAVCHRYCKDFKHALQTLQQLKEIYPDHGRAHQEEGHCHLGLGNIDHALRAYERGCYYNPALVASFKARIELHKQLGQSAQAVSVGAQLKYLQSLPKPLIAVMDLVSQGKLLKAEDLCKKFMRQMPHNVEGMRLLADIAIRLGVLEDAEFLLESALELEPANTRARIDYIGALRKRQQYDKALSQAKYLLQTQPDSLQYKSIFAIECMQSGNFDRALTVFDDILQSLPTDPVTLTSKGHALKTKGDSDKAIASYQASIKANHGHGEAFYSLANLKTYRFNESEVDSMATLSSNSNLSFMDRVYINFALGKAYEDIHNYPASFHHYQTGNALKKSQSRYRAKWMTEELAAQKALFTADFLESRDGLGHPAKDPIFILGLPRAGSTLLEQILSSHSEIDGTLELPNILSLSQRLRRTLIQDTTPGYPAVLNKLTAADFTRFGKEYIEDTFCHRHGAHHFIDKMPNNFRHVGLIKLILPNAKIIDARRNPLDCCWSGYKQLFAEGQEFTYDLSDIGQYYRDYVDLMSHWDKVIPEFVLRVNNEDVIEDLEGQVRRILEFCELPFEEACLNFHQTQRNVRTPSAEQVRKPVSRAGVAQWKPFREYLAPLQKVLGEDLIQLSYEHAESNH